MIGALLAILGLLLLAPVSAGAVDVSWVLDSFGESPCGSRLRAVQGVNPACYDTFDDLTPSTGTTFHLTIDAPTLSAISNGDSVTLHDFFLPPPPSGESSYGLSIDGFEAHLTVGLANLGTPQAVIPDPFFVIDELEGMLVETSPGVFAATFPTFPIYWSGALPPFGLSGSGTIPLTLSTVQTFINFTSTTPAVPGVSPEVPGFCTGGSPDVPGVGYPLFPLPLEGSSFAPGSRIAIGGATCPSGLSAFTNLPERAFSVELQGFVATPQCDDGIDNDGDGLVDIEDWGCADSSDGSERSPDLACDDGLDNDGDGWNDFDPATLDDPLTGSGDPACANVLWQSETTECQDGIDNEGDGRIDFDGGASLDLDGDGFIDGQFNPEQPAVAGRDFQCGKAWQDLEARVGGQRCGLGFELALLLPVTMWLHGRRRRRATSH